TSYPKLLAMPNGMAARDGTRPKVGERSVTMAQSVVFQKWREMEILSCRSKAYESPYPLLKHYPFAMIPGHAPSVMRSLSLGVVENNAERVTVSRPDAADAMAEIDAIPPACPLHRALMHREQHAVPLP